MRCSLNAHNIYYNIKYKITLNYHWDNYIISINNGDNDNDVYGSNDGYWSNDNYSSNVDHKSKIMDDDDEQNYELITEVMMIMHN